MATASTAQPSRGVLHVRGNWSTRDDRVPSAVWLGIFWVGIIAGFGVDFPRFLHETPPAPTVIRVHAVVFSTWLFLITAQVLLVLRDRVAWHRKLGWVLAGWACLMAVLGPWAAMASQAVDLHGPEYDPPFLSVNIVDLGGFLILLACSIALRKNPAAHKRLMMLATVSIADPGFNRFASWIWPTEPHSVILWFFYVFYGNVLLIVLMAAWDWWRGRILRSFVIGATALLAAEYVVALLYFWPPWKTLTTEWVLVWAKHFA